MSECVILATLYVGQCIVTEHISCRLHGDVYHVTFSLHLLYRRICYLDHCVLLVKEVLVRSVSTYFASAVPEVSQMVLIFVS
jgi:hypothetical protein